VVRVETLAAAKVPAGRPDAPPAAAPAADYPSLDPDETAVALLGSVMVCSFLF
jgi:hypothetical protein